MTPGFARKSRQPGVAFVPQLAVASPRVAAGGDRHEVEAERAADAVVRGDHGFALSRLAGDGVAAPVQEAREEQAEQRPSAAAPAKADAAAPPPPAGGAPLDAGTRGAMEASFGHDFSQVRVHTDSRADQAARGMHALAYTAGTDIGFAAGQFAPDTSRGRHLIAHELAHVVQQRGTPAARQPVQRRSVLESIGIFFGVVEGRFSDEELTDYLTKVSDSGEIEKTFDSDNKARAIVRKWKASDPRFNLVAAQKVLLIKEMLDGPTLDDDERAILDLLRLSDNTDLRHIIGASGVTLEDLDSNLHGDEQEQLDALIAARFKGGREAVAGGTVEPEGDVPLEAPTFTYDFAVIRAKIEGDYTAAEIVAELSQLAPTQLEQAERDLIADRTARVQTVATLLEQFHAASDKATEDRIRTRGHVAMARQQKTEDILESLFRDVALTESKAALLGKTTKLTKEQKAAAREALKPEVPTQNGKVPDFQSTLPGETESYEQKLRALLPGVIQDHWDSLVKDKGETEHADSTKTHTLKEMEDIGNAAKEETDAVFGRYYDPGKHPRLKADTPKKRGNIHDLFADMTKSLAKMSKKQRRDLARQLILYFFQSDDPLRAVNTAHFASPEFNQNDKPKNDEAKVLAKLADEFTATEAQVKQLNEIDRNWGATALGREINVQLFRPQTVEADRDFLWDAFQTFIHEYMHTLVHSKYDAYARDFGASSNEYNTLIEGVDCVLAETVWTNVQPRVTDPGLRTKVEGPTYAKLPPVDVRPPSRARYPSFGEALKLVSLVGIRNVYAAYFLGDVEKIGR